MGRVPKSRGENTSLVAAIGLDEGVSDAMTSTGAVAGVAFLAYLEHPLAPRPRPGQIVVLDRLGVHRKPEVREAIEARGCGSCNTLLICLCPTLRMTHDHPTLIKEAPSELLEHERRHRHSITGSRIRMLRLLKRGEAKSVREAGELIGYSWRHTRRWLTTY